MDELKRLKKLSGLNEDMVDSSIGKDELEFVVKLSEHLGKYRSNPYILDHMSEILYNYLSRGIIKATDDPKEAAEKIIQRYLKETNAVPESVSENNDKSVLNEISLNRDEIKVGMKFLHSRVLKADTDEPALYVVTKIAQGNVYYKQPDEKRAKLFSPIEQFPKYVKEIVKD